VIVARHERAALACKEIEVGALVGLQHVVDVSSGGFGAFQLRRRRFSSSSETSSWSFPFATSSSIGSPFSTSASAPPAAASGTMCSTTVP
jgi:hypothetical protein